MRQHGTRRFSALARGLQGSTHTHNHGVFREMHVALRPAGNRQGRGSPLRIRKGGAIKTGWVCWVPPEKRNSRKLVRLCSETTATVSDPLPNLARDTDDLAVTIRVAIQLSVLQQKYC